MSRLTNLRRALGVSLLAFPVFAVSAFAQHDCRGWTRTCASVDVRAEGDNLILFVPNAGIDDQGEGAAAEAENVTVVPQPLDAEPFDIPPGTSVSTTPTSDDPGNISCDDDESHYQGSRGLDEDEERRCGQPVGALFLLAVPATVAIFAPGNGDDPTVEGPLPQSGNPDTGGEGDGANDGVGDGGDREAGDEYGSDDSGGSDTPGSDSGGGSGVNSAGQGSGGNGGGSGTGAGTGGSGQNDGTDGGTGADYGPFHPDAGDLPPISQVPEPVSTTLFTLGLAGYAGAQLRRRRLDEAIEEDC
jgi:hypothetical protein